MNGIGWVCDECGETVVVPGEQIPAVGRVARTHLYEVVKAAPARAAASERWEFCSVECIHAQTTPKDTGADASRADREG